jgi:cell division protein FtsB
MSKAWLTAVLVLMLVGLQYRLWVADGGIAHSLRLKHEVERNRTEVAKLRARNAKLDASVRNLKLGLDEIEIRARHSLGMVRQGETFYLVVHR